MLNAVASHILALPAWLALLVVFVLPAAESSIFVGFVFPGEVALIAGGVLASQGKVPLAAVLAAGAAGAAVGDSIGYGVGHRYGRRVLEGALGRFVRPHHFDRAEAYLADRGGKAVFFGRFTASLRAMIPGLAGMARMPYGRFAVYNVAGAVVWATVTVMLGYVGGSSWQHLAHLASRIGLGALGLFVLAFLLGWVLRRTRLSGDGSVSVSELWVRAGHGLSGSRPGRWCSERFPVQVSWLARRLDPYAPRGLAVTILVFVSGACAWIFGGLTQDVVAHEGLARSDASVHAWALAHRTGWLDAVMRTATWAGSSVVLVPAVVLVGVLWWRAHRSWRRPVALAALYVAAVATHAVVAASVERPRPPAGDWLAHASGWAYPSGHATQVMAFSGGVLLLAWIGRGDGGVPSRAVTVPSVLLAVSVVALVAASRVYLGVHWLTDVLGGLTLGAALACLMAVVTACLLPTSAGEREGPVADREEADAERGRSQRLGLSVPLLQR
jgi:undecaprenyl-diphosphatase